MRSRVSEAAGFATRGLKRLILGSARCRPAPAVPSGMRVYAIGDVHGSAAALDALHRRIADDMATAANRTCIVVYLGDYIDRGADSAGVLDRLTSPAPPGWQRRFVLGNHEAALLGFLEEPDAHLAWLEYGGLETVASYGVRLPRGDGPLERARRLSAVLADRLPPAHLAFLRALESRVELGDYLFVHAGIRPGRALRGQRLEDLLTIREPFLSSTAWHGKVVVHGHSITAQPELLPNRIGLDTGAYGGGPLSCLVLDAEQRSLIAVHPSKSATGLKQPFVYNPTAEGI